MSGRNSKLCLGKRQINGFKDDGILFFHTGGFYCSIIHNGAHPRRTVLIIITENWVSQCTTGPQPRIPEKERKATTLFKSNVVFMVSCTGADQPGRQGRWESDKHLMPLGGWERERTAHPNITPHQSRLRPVPVNSKPPLSLNYFSRWYGMRWGEMKSSHNFIFH